MTDDAPDRPRADRRKSEKRQRTRQIKARMTEDEHAAFLDRADKAGLAAAAFLRAAAIGNAGPRAQRRLPADAAALREVLGHLGKIGSNLNQIARYLHTGGIAETVLPDLRAALTDHARLRGLIYDALGKEPDGASPASPSAASKFIPPPPEA
ncbi:MAG TPA: MobC family plasmid mobilization relaxosome protein [Pelagibacterium sp.]|uniref:MobC family plasmid mobilization relaxosome protein n=1 Tax=Pelagibacterium sp. TaxID=1967288 RepID=UPI002B8769F7|nr:MobC family plasmid mobilization relaxosome protein [Pelagibacterium sp.]HWJ87615.1 MobC family plasmid mobilization relaxosome protein [Pelagibacterium sp.]